MITIIVGVLCACAGFFLCALLSCKRIEEAEYESARSRQRWAELAEVVATRTEQSCRK